MATKIVHDCGTGQVAQLDLPAAEAAAMAAVQQAAVQASGAGAAQRATDIATVRAKATTDSAFAALARLLGVS